MSTFSAGGMVVGKSVIARWGPRFCSKLNIAFDLLAMISAVLLCGDFGARAAICALGAASCWAVASFVVRYYDPWANRSGVEETAMVSLLVLGVVAALTAVSEGPRGAVWL